MSELERNRDQAIRERAYFIWEQEGRPKGRAEEHWTLAAVEGSHHANPRDDDHLHDEEKILAGRNDVNYPALLTRDVPGG